MTGASGYLGGRVVAELAGAGWRVVSLGRRPAALPGAEHIRFRLGDDLSPERLEGLDAVVHCAWDFDQRSWEDIVRVNVEGSARLFESVAAAGVRRLVHVSTVSASGEPRSMYGRSKLRTEAEAAERGGLVVRPGLLYGPEAGGMVGMLEKLVAALPVVPVLVGEERPLYLAHQADVCAQLRLLAEGVERPAGPLVAAARDPHSLREVLGALAAAMGKRRRFVRVPWQLLYLPLRLLELARVPAPIRSDSALSIATLDPDPFASGVAPTIQSFRPFALE